MMNIDNCTLYDHMILKYYIENTKHSFEEYKKQYVLNDKLYSKEYLMNLLNKTINEIKKREKDVTIHISDFIKDNYKKLQLFNTYTISSDEGAKDTKNKIMSNSQHIIVNDNLYIVSSFNFNSPDTIAHFKIILS